MWEDVDPDNMSYEVGVYYSLEGSWLCLVFNDSLCTLNVVYLAVFSDFGYCYSTQPSSELIWSLSSRFY